jgi:hypothetical protein
MMYGPNAAFGVALALVLCVIGARPLEAPAHHSAANAHSPRVVKVKTTAGAIEKQRAIETAVLGPEHADEHVAVLSAQREWARLGHQPNPDSPRQALASEGVEVAAAGPPSEVGAWTQAPFETPTFAINTTLLPTGKVMIWGRPPSTGTGDPRPNVGEAALWSPWLGTGANAFEAITPPVIDVDGPGGQPPAPAPVFCSGLSQLPDGQVLVAGGNLIYGNTFDDDGYTKFAGLQTIFTFDPFSETWTQQPTMANGRWYPTQTLLPDGRTIITGGLSDVPPGGVQNKTLEIFNPPSTFGGQGTLEPNPGTGKNFGLYPRTFTLNSGKVLFAGPQVKHTWTLDTTSFTWNGYPHLSRNRQYGNAVRLPGGPSGSDAFTTLGGYATAPPPDGSSFHPATETTETTNAAVAVPSWTPGASWNVARANSNTVLLPDRSMVTVGGGSGYAANGGGGGYVTYADGRARRVEVYDPATDSWTLGPAQEEDRAYHSTAVLLPDGRVLSGGDDLHPLEPDGKDSQTDKAEIYSPPYLFKGARPAIGSAPQAVRWGDAFGIQTTSPNIDKAVLMAPAATTHGFDVNQRYVDLKILETFAGEGLDVAAPPSSRVAPPGYYMLFLINEDGVPSVADWVRIDPSAPDQPTIGPPPAPPAGDFNADGYSDLAVGVPGEDVGSATDAGAVNVIYGSAGGLSDAGNQSFTQNDLGGEAAASDNRFGAAVTVADFDDDGFADLAVGAPGEDQGSANAAGAVDVLYGSPGGLSASGHQALSQGGGGIQGSASAGDRFGAALAAADLNGDGEDDLAIGAPGDSVGSTAAGGVNVIYGSGGGLTATGNQLWTQNSAGVLDASEGGDSFGSAVAAGDLNGDGEADLAVGVPAESVGTKTGAGAVEVLYGSAGGVTSAGNQLWTQNSAGVLDAAEADDSFGAALASGDLDGDGRKDLAIGVPAENMGTTKPDAGAVNVLYGSAGGLSDAGNQYWTQNSADILDSAASGESFGAALTTADLNGDGEADLAAGVPGEGVGTLPSGGAVNVIYGSAARLNSTGNQLWTQNSGGVLDVAEDGDSFGDALAAGDVDRDGHADMAIGVPGESIGTAAAGALHLLYGSAGGLTSAANQLWSQNTLNILDQAEAGDQFGAAMGLVAD